MKRRIISALLALVMLLSLLPASVIAASTPSIPSGWSHDALAFAVNNGILKGDANGNLRPNDPMTRAEMASVLVRLLNLTEGTSLAGYTDCKASAWYYADMAKAVAAGLFNGVTEKQMQPGGHISREQAITVLCRALGLVSTQPDCYMLFSDCDAISQYARSAVSAARELKYVTGYSDGTLKPKQEITRAQIAQLLYNILTKIVDSPDQLPASGNVLYRGSAPIPDGYTLRGSLFLTGALPEVHVSGLSISGYLFAGRTKVLDAADSSCLWMFLTKADSLVKFGGSVDTIFVNGSGITVNAAPRRLQLLDAKNAVFDGDVSVALASGSSVSISGHASILHVANSSVKNASASIGTCVVYDNSAISGSTIRNVVTYAKKTNISAPIGTVHDRVGKGLEKLSLQIAPITPLSKPDTTLSIRATLADGTTDGLGRFVTLSWYQGSKLLHSSSFLMSGNSISEQLLRSYHLANDPVSDSYRVVLTCGDSAGEQIGAVTTDTAWLDYRNALSTVDTTWIPVTVNVSCYVYKDRSMSTVLRKVSAGKKLYNEYNPQSGVLQVSFPDSGEKGWIYTNNVTISTAAVYNSSKPYSKATAEGFVDKMGYSSKTSYLFWVSRKTQHVYVFKGSKGKWKVERDFLCSSGKNATPTPRGTYTTLSKVARWNFDSYFVYNPVIFHGGHAFHSVPYNYDGTVYSGTVGKPLSHGCVRLKYDDIMYVNTIALGATVVVY